MSSRLSFDQLFVLASHHGDDVDGQQDFVLRESSAEELGPGDFGDVTKEIPQNLQKVVMRKT